MPLKTRYLALFGAAIGLAALGAAHSETVVRLSAPEQVKVTRLPGSVEGLAADIAVMAAPAPVSVPAPVASPAPVPAPRTTVVTSAPDTAVVVSAPRATIVTDAAPLRSLRPDPRPVDLAIARTETAPVVYAAPVSRAVTVPHAAGGCAALAAMPAHLVEAAFPGFSGLLKGSHCPR